MPPQIKFFKSTSLNRLSVRLFTASGLTKISFLICVGSIVSICYLWAENALADDQLCPRVPHKGKTTEDFTNDIKQLYDCIDKLQKEENRLRDQPPAQVQVITCTRAPIKVDSTTVTRDGVTAKDEMQIDFTPEECKHKIIEGWEYVPALLGTDVCGGITEYHFTYPVLDSRSLSIHLNRNPNRPQCSNPQDQGSISAAWIGTRASQ